MPSSREILRTNPTTLGRDHAGALGRRVMSTLLQISLERPMATQATSPPAIGNRVSPDLRYPSILGRVLRERRHQLGITQGQLVDLLATQGHTLSRGHLSHIELGRYIPSPATLEALDNALGLGGSAIGFGTDQNDLEMVELGRDIVNYVNPRELLSVSGDGSAAVTRPSLSASDFILRSDQNAVTGSTALIEQAILSVLDRLLNLQPSQEPLRIAGFTELGLENGKPGLTRAVRERLRDVLEHGWHVVHYVPLGPVRHEGALARVCLPLLRCPRFEPRIVAGSLVGSHEGTILLPSIAVLQCFPSTTAERLDTAVVSFDPETVSAHTRRIDYVAQRSTSFVDRTERPEPSGRADLGHAELLFKRSLADNASNSGERRLMLGWFANSTIPLLVYSEMLRRRELAATQPAPWAQLIAWQKVRSESLHRHLIAGARYREVVTLDNILAYVQSGAISASAPGWRRTPVLDRVAHLTEVCRLLDLYEFYEVGVAGRSTPIARAIDDVRWEVLGSGDAFSAVLVQSEYRLSGSGGVGRSNDKQRVDLRIRQPVVSRAFGAYFDKLWSESGEIETSKATVTALLRAMISDLIARGR